METESPAVRLLSAPRRGALNWKHLHDSPLHLPPLCLHVGAAGKRGPPTRACAHAHLSISPSLGLPLNAHFAHSLLPPSTFRPTLATPPLTTLRYLSSRLQGHSLHLYSILALPPTPTPGHVLVGVSVLTYAPPLLSCPRQALTPSTRGWRKRVIVSRMIHWCMMCAYAAELAKAVAMWKRAGNASAPRPNTSTPSTGQSPQ